jgi:hypothetical protein
LRWAGTIESEASSTVGQPELTGLYAEPGPSQPDRLTELTSLDDGPIAPISIGNAPEEFTSIDNAPEEWRAKFADLLLATTCCWPELEPDFELTGNVGLGDARPEVGPAQQSLSWRSFVEDLSAWLARAVRPVRLLAGG